MNISLQSFFFPGISYLTQDKLIQTQTKGVNILSPMIFVDKFFLQIAQLVPIYISSRDLLRQLTCQIVMSMSYSNFLAFNANLQKRYTSSIIKSCTFFVQIHQLLVFCDVCLHDGFSSYLLFDEPFENKLQTLCP